jgi:structure-specific endonuclease subunit SLX1
MWAVYLLVSGSRTYVGCTTDVTRRLRQHNGEIRGGARATRGRQWAVVLYVEGFPNRSVACTFEALVKKRARGLSQRKTALVGLSKGKCPQGRTHSRHYEPPKYLILQGEI